MQFDTSGRVACTDPHKPCICYAATWDRLNPFTQGYVEALFASRICIRDGSEGEPLSGPVSEWYGFSDLAPETLARIMVDCERFRRPRTSSKSAAVGALFWKNRAGNYLSDDGWMPLTLALGPDGKVVFL